AAAAVAPSFADLRLRVYDAVKAHCTERLQPIADRHAAAAFDLLDRMLPTVAVDLPKPVVKRAAEVCGA
ncbi:MAG TPA: hypothetical protein VN213_18315, partial [Solirubrobacteraceae bacterium]|nr:hypothetical protein [Solirubrobacteraceae bacterium]